MRPHARPPTCTAFHIRDSGSWLREGRTRSLRTFHGVGGGGAGASWPVAIRGESQQWQPETSAAREARIDLIPRQRHTWRREYSPRLDMRRSETQAQSNGTLYPGGSISCDRCVMRSEIAIQAGARPLRESTPTRHPPNSTGTALQWARSRRRSSGQTYDRAPN